MKHVLPAVHIFLAIILVVLIIWAFTESPERGVQALLWPIQMRSAD